jgi:hypothetical protein
VTRNQVAVVVALVFVAINLTVLAVNGIRHGGDTPLYLDGASSLLEGRPLVGRQLSYRGYVALIATMQALGGGLLGVVLAQIVAGGVAAAAVWSMASAAAGRVAGTAAATLVVLDVSSNRWFHYVLADSLYASLAVLGVLVVHRAATRPGIEPIVSAAVLVIAAGLVRPEGWFLLGAAVLYVIAMRARTTTERWAGAGALVAATAFLAVIVAPAMGGNVQAVGPAEMLRRGQTIWDFDGWRVAMPQSDVPVSGQAADAIAYALDNPISTVKLMLARVGVHFAHVRPFYSAAHNAAIVIWLLPVYAAAIAGAWRWRRSMLTRWVIAAIASQTLVVALTHAEWEGRYLAHVLPLVYVLAGAAMAGLWNGDRAAPALEGAL